ncbi:Bacteriophage T7 tail fibre protein [uncultured Caudovirales phage]|uniref:Bacteriophage T7 tail fibre protein n=1 Tax=uncultured Caudovirales phage TaxID=2100421 RepID=A0A6J5M126_9CAUD|nr:Bacteriophage T7 tail fibre protein [uncultured Caudovirales phage]
MPLSYQLHVTSTSTTGPFSFAAIDGYLSLSHIDVYINDQEIAAFTVNEQTKQITLNSAVPAGTAVRIQRNTPNTEAGRVIDFTDGSVLTADDLDKASRQTLYITQEANDTATVNGMAKNPEETAWDADNLRIINVGSPLSSNDAANKTWVESQIVNNSISLTGQNWNANNRKITNLTNGTASNEAVTRGYVDGVVFQGDGFAVPQTWTFAGTGGNSYVLPSPTPFGTDPNMFLVEVGGVIQNPANYNIIGATNTLQFSAGSPPNGSQIIVRNFGYARNIASFGDLVTFNNGIAVTGNANVTGTVTAAGFSGPISGAVTGNVTGNVQGNVTGNVTGNLTGTVQTAAQPNITSVGTLGSLAVTNNLAVDTDTLLVDATNDRVGINIANPTEALDVVGNGKFSGNVAITGNISAANLASLAGGLRQVVEMSASTQTSTLTSAGGVFSDTGILLSITPTQASSRLIILASVNAFAGTTGGAAVGSVSCDLKIEGGTGATPASWSLVKLYKNAVGIIDSIAQESIVTSNVFLFAVVSPGTTGTVTYKITVAKSGTGVAANVLTAGVNMASTSISSLALIEIGV